MHEPNGSHTSRKSMCGSGIVLRDKRERIRRIDALKNQSYANLLEIVHACVETEWEEHKIPVPVHYDPQKLEIAARINGQCFTAVDPATLWLNMAASRLSESCVTKAIENFDASLLGCICVNRVDQGLWIIDGLYRAVAAYAHGCRELPAILYDDMTQAEEARMFLDLNKVTKPLCTRDAFRISLTANDPCAKAVKHVCDEHGLASVIRGKPEEPYLAAITTAQEIVRRHDGSAKSLDWSIGLLDDAGWLKTVENSAFATSSAMLSALDNVYQASTEEQRQVLKTAMEGTWPKTFKTVLEATADPIERRHRAYHLLTSMIRAEITADSPIWNRGN